MYNNKANRNGWVNEKTLIGTSDVSKYSLTCFVRCPNGYEIKPFKVTNDWAGIDKFWQLLRETKIKHQLDEIIVGFESTGCYGEPLIVFMKDKPVKLVQINPMHTKRVKELSDNSPNKTDNKDPVIIADIIQLGHYLSMVKPDGAAAELRQLTHTRLAQLGYQNGLINQLESLMFRVWPEFVQIMGTLTGKTARYLIAHYPQPDKIRKFSLAKLTAKIKRVSRGRMGQDKAGQLLESSKHSLGIRDGLQSALIEIKQILKQLDQIDQFMKVLEQKMAEEIARIPYSQNLLSIKGLGVVSLGGIIGELGSFKSYQKQSEVVKMAGLDLYEISSGLHKGMKRLSHRGRSLLRTLLFLATLNMVRKDGIFNQDYERLLARGMIKIKALLVIARKLLRIMFALVRDGSEYKVGYENNKPRQKLEANITRAAG